MYSSFFKTLRRIAADTRDPMLAVRFVVLAERWDALVRKRRAGGAAIVSPIAMTPEPPTP